MATTRARVICCFLFFALAVQRLDAAEEDLDVAEAQHHIHHNKHGYSYPKPPPFSDYNPDESEGQVDPGGSLPEISGGYPAAIGHETEEKVDSEGITPDPLPPGVYDKPEFEPNDACVSEAGCIPGTPGDDYPNYPDVPKTGFICPSLSGYYGDIQARCQVFHVCIKNKQKVKQYSFLCPNGTIFSQDEFICVWWHDFKCESTPSLYHLNKQLHWDDEKVSLKQKISNLQRMIRAPGSARINPMNFPQQLLPALSLRLPDARQAYGLLQPTPPPISRNDDDNRDNQGQEPLKPYYPTVEPDEHTVFHGSHEDGDPHHSGQRRPYTRPRYPNDHREEDHHEEDHYEQPYRQPARRPYRPPPARYPSQDYHTEEDHEPYRPPPRRPYRPPPPRYPSPDYAEEEPQRPYRPPPRRPRPPPPRYPDEQEEEPQPPYRPPPRRPRPPPPRYPDEQEEEQQPPYRPPPRRPRPPPPRYPSPDEQQPQQPDPYPTPAPPPYRPPPTRKPPPPVQYPSPDETEQEVQPGGSYPTPTTTTKKPTPPPYRPPPVRYPEPDEKEEDIQPGGYFPTTTTTPKPTTQRPVPTPKKKVTTPQPKTTSTTTLKPYVPEVDESEEDIQPGGQFPTTTTTPKPRPRTTATPRYRIPTKKITTKKPRVHPEVTHRPKQKIYLPPPQPDTGYSYVEHPDPGYVGQTLPNYGPPPPPVYGPPTAPAYIPPTAPPYIPPPPPPVYGPPAPVPGPSYNIPLNPPAVYYPNQPVVGDKQYDGVAIFLPRDVVPARSPVVSLQKDYLQNGVIPALGPIEPIRAVSYSYPPAPNIPISVNQQQHLLRAQEQYQQQLDPNFEPYQVLRSQRQSNSRKKGQKEQTKGRNKQLPPQPRPSSGSKNLPRKKSQAYQSTYDEREIGDHTQQFRRQIEPQDLMLAETNSMSISQILNPLVPGSTLDPPQRSIEIQTRQLDLDDDDDDFDPPISPQPRPRPTPSRPQPMKTMTFLDSNEVLDKDPQPGAQGLPVNLVTSAPTPTPLPLSNERFQEPVKTSDGKVSVVLPPQLKTLLLPNGEEPTELELIRSRQIFARTYTSREKPKGQPPRKIAPIKKPLLIKPMKPSEPNERPHQPPRPPHYRPPPGPPRQRERNRLHLNLNITKY